MGARGAVSKAKLYYIIPDVRTIWSFIPKQPSQVWNHMNKPRRTIILSQTRQEMDMHTFIFPTQWICFWDVGYEGASLSGHAD